MAYWFSIKCISKCPHSCPHTFRQTLQFLIPIHLTQDFHIWTLQLQEQEQEGGDIAVLCIVWIHNLLFLKTTILTFPRVIPGFLVWFLSRETPEQSQVGRLLNIINNPTCLRYKSIGPFFFLIWIILQFILMCIVVKSIATWLKNENIFLFASSCPTPRYYTKSNIWSKWK